MAAEAMSRSAAQASIRGRFMERILARGGHGHFPPKIALHLAFDAFRSIAAAEEVVELRQRRLGGHIESADDAGTSERGAGRVFGEIDRSFETLRAIDDDHAAAGGISQSG